MEVTVRKAKAEDLEAINELTDRMHHHLASLYRLELSSDELEDEHFDEEELENVYVAESADEGVIGYMSFSKGKDEWAGPHYEIEHIVVREDHKRLGIGRKLFKILLEKASREGANITTGTFTRNKTALRFYQKLGFKPLTTRFLLDLQKRMLNKPPPTSYSTKRRSKESVAE